MKNPLRDETAAFQLVLLSLGYFGLIVLASWLSGWLGLATFVLLTSAAVALALRGRKRRQRDVSPFPGRASVEDTPEGVGSHLPADDET